MLEAIKVKANNVISVINSSNIDYAQKKSQITAIEELQNTKIKEIYQESIISHVDMLTKLDLEPNERIALENIDINPRLCIIIDDCSEKIQSWMKMFKKGEVNCFDSILYRGRHNFITLIFAAHDDKLISTELRKNARVTIYTTSQSLITSINKPGNGFTSKEKKDVSRYATRVFGKDNGAIKNHQKLCYIREDSNPFRYTIANLYPEFTLGSKSLRCLIDLMPKKSDNLINNPYAQNTLKKINSFSFK
jgi:hypothetical protein